MNNTSGYLVNGVALTVSIPLIEIQAVLGIILTVINILVFVIRVILNIKKRLNDGQFTNEERAETAREILELTEQIAELQARLQDASNDASNDSNTESTE